MNGDYLTKDRIHHVRKTIVFNGIENGWRKAAVTNVDLFVCDNAVADAKQNGLCNYAQYKQAAELDKFYITTTGSLALGFSEHGTTTLEQFKAWLVSKYNEGNPLTVEYDILDEKLEEYIEDLTDEQREALEPILFEGYNKITCTNEIKPILQAEYYINNKLNNTYAKRFDRVEEDISDLQENKLDKEDMADTGWIPLTLNSNFKNYNNISTNSPEYRKIGKTVQIRGQLSPAEESVIANGVEVTAITLPREIVPSKSLYRIGQGSVRNIFMYSVKYDTGNFTIGRYRTTDSYPTTVATTAWLPFDITYMVD